jgi:excinuclease ABC subunit C
VLLRDDKTYPYIKLTSERFPRVYVTRRLIKDGSTYFGPYFPANLAYRLVNFIHRHFLVPSCKVDLTRFHPKPCLQFHIHRCLGPCVEGLVAPETYAQAVRQTKLFLEGKHHDLGKELREQIQRAADETRFEEAASIRDLLTTVEEMDERQKMAAASGDDVDIFGFHAEPPLVAVNLFHLRNGRIVDRREFFWEDQTEFNAPEFFSSLLLQIYLDQRYVPAFIHVPIDFEDREVMEELLSEKRTRKVEIHTPQRGQKKAMLNLAETNAKHSFDARFRVMKPSSAAIQSALQEALGLPDPPKRIECFDISHIQGTDKVASMVVWEDGRMKKADYRKFIIRSVAGNDDFASMKEVVTRRYERLQQEGAPFPGLVLVDGGLGQLHAAADALESLGIINQPLASIAKREEIVYVLGQENDPVVLDRFSPILHLIQLIRDEAHRFAVTFHRTRRNARTLTSELDRIPGVGEITVRKLLKEFGSSTLVRQASEAELARRVGPAAARKVKAWYERETAPQ